MKTVLITGCSSGFGRDLAIRLSHSGWRVLAGFRDAAHESVSNLQREAGDSLHPLALDITIAAQRQDAVEVVERLCQGRLDALIHNAGYGLFGALEELEQERLRHSHEVLALGPANLTQLLLPALRAARGRLVFLSSVMGYAALPLSSAYCMGKFAIEGMAESLRLELAPLGVHVTLIQPGGFRTGFGAGLRWAQSRAPSPYALATRAYRMQTQARLARPGKNPQPVVDAIIRILGRRHPPLRVRVGMDAHLMALLKTALPNSIYFRLVQSLFRRMNRSAASDARK